MVRCFSCSEKIDRSEEEVTLVSVRFHAGKADLPHHEECAP